MADACKLRGNKALAAGDTDAAIAAYTDGLEALDAGGGDGHDDDFERAILLSNRSASFAKSGRFAEALWDAQEALVCRPDWAKAYGRKGAALCGLAELDEALLAYDAGLQLDSASREEKEALAKGRAAAVQQQQQKTLGTDAVAPDEANADVLRQLDELLAAGYITEEEHVRRGEALRTSETVPSSSTSLSLADFAVAGSNEFDKVLSLADFTISGDQVLSLSDFTTGVASVLDDEGGTFVQNASAVAPNNVPLDGNMIGLSTSEGMALGSATAILDPAIAYPRRPAPPPKTTAPSLASGREGGSALVNVSGERTFRIFLSSTFRDMKEERELLVKRVLPEVRRVAAARGVQVTAIDFRWGITTEESANHQVLWRCLREIDNCRPYFLGFVGERYGWSVHSCSNAIEVSKLNATLDRAVSDFPWVDAYRDRSVTELEMLYGGLFWPDCAASRASFFLRDLEYSQTLSETQRRHFEPDTSAEAAAAIDLRARIEASGLSALHYNSPSNFAAAARQELLDVLDRDFPVSDEPGVAQNEEQSLVRVLQQFAHERASTHVARGDTLDKIDQFVRSRLPEVGPKPAGGILLVTGPGGCGRTSTICAWYDRFSRDPTAAPSVLHVCGLLDGGDLTNMLRSILVQLKFSCGIQGPIPESEEEIASTFLDWLQTAAQDSNSPKPSGVGSPGCVIVIDGLEKLEEAAQSLPFMPSQLPPGIVVIVSANSDSVAAYNLIGRKKLNLQTSNLQTSHQQDDVPVQSYKHQVRSRNAPVPIAGNKSARHADIILTVNPLDSHEKRLLIEAYLSRWSKNLSFAQRSWISDAPQTSNSAYLNAVLGALRVYGDYEGLDDFVRKTLLGADSLVELFSRILKQWEADWGSAFVSNACGLIAASRRGLVEAELLACLQLMQKGTDSVTLLWSGFADSASDVLTGLGAGGGVITFSQSQFEEAAKQKYKFADKKRQIELTGVLSRFFSAEVEQLASSLEETATGATRSFSIAKRKVSECLFQLSMLAPESPPARQQLSSQLGKLHVFELMSTDAVGRLDLLRWWKIASNDDGLVAAARGYWNAFQGQVVEESELAVERSLRLARFASEVGAYDTAESALAFAGSCANACDYVSLVAKVLHETSLLALACGQFDKAAQAAVSCLTAHISLLSSTPTFTDREPAPSVDELVQFAIPLMSRASTSMSLKVRLSEDLALIALVAKKQSDYTRAAQLYESSVQLVTATYGGRHPLVARTQLALADVFRKQAKHDEAERLYHKALVVLRSSYGDSHPSVADCLEGLGRCAKKRGAYNDAYPLYCSALTIVEALFGKSHVRVAELCLDLGDTLRKTAAWDESLQNYERALKIYRSLHGDDHPDTAEVLNQLGVLYKTRGDCERALVFVQRALEISERVLGSHHVKVAVVCVNLADVKSIDGEYKEATLLYERALRIYEQHYGLDHPEVSEVLNALGMIEKKVGRYKDAERRFARSLEIIERAYGLSHPKVALYAHNLGVVARKLKQFDRSWELYNRALQVNSDKFGVRHPLVAGNLNGLGMLRKETGKDLDEALEFHRRALQIFEETFGREDKNVALTLNLLAEVYRKQGKNDYDESEAVYERALVINRKCFRNRDHPEIAENLNGLAQVYKAQQNYRKAEPLFVEAIRMSEATLGKTHPHVINRYRNLANLHENLGQVEEAQVVWSKVAQLKEARQKELNAW